MDFVQVIILAILQGLTEWLPISSEGQLVLLLHNLANTPLEDALTIAFFLHLGTASVVLIRFREEYLKMGKEAFSVVKKTAENRADRSILLRPVVIATMGTAITAIPIVLFLKDFWRNEYADFLNLIIGLFLIITGLLLAKQKTTGEREFEIISNKEALILGLAQGFASLPGISRSGITITVLLYFGLRSAEALRGSFLISVPAVVGAFGLDIVTNILKGQTIAFDWFLMILGIIIVFIVGWISMDGFLRISRRFPFGTFCILLGLFIIIIGVASLLLGGLT